MRVPGGTLVRLVAAKRKDKNLELIRVGVVGTSCFFFYLFTCFVFLFLTVVLEGKKYVRYLSRPNVFG